MLETQGREGGFPASDHAREKTTLSQPPCDCEIRGMKCLRYTIEPEDRCGRCGKVFHVKRGLGLLDGTGDVSGISTATPFSGFGFR
jgi:hypothetical protein